MNISESDFLADRAKLEAHYDKVSGIYLEDFPIENAELFFDVLKESFPGEIIFNAGCGPGKQSNFMQEQGFHVIGADISENTVNISRKNYPNILVGKLDITEIDEYLPENLVAGVYSGFVDHHLSEEASRKAMRAQYKILKPGGVLYMATQVGDDNERVELTHPNEGEDVPIYLRRASKILEIAEDSGFLNLRLWRRNPRPNEYKCDKLYIFAMKRIENLSE